LNVLKQNPSLAEEQIDLGKVAAKVTEKVATDCAPKPSAPHTKPSTKPSTKPKITNPRKPPSSSGKRPLDTVYKKADSLVPATAQTTPQPPARAPKKQKLPAQPETRAPPASRGCQQEVPKRVTRSTARAAEAGKVKTGRGSNFASQTRNQLLKSKTSHEMLIRKHTEKLAAYIIDPDKYDNLGILKNVSKEIRQKIIQGRIKELERQIQRQRDDLNIINRLLKSKDL